VAEAQGKEQRGSKMYLTSTSGVRYGQCWAALRAAAGARSWVGGSVVVVVVIVIDCDCDGDG
jgi:hypothetical protein